MILRALYDYYQRCEDLPAFGMELKEIGFIIVIDSNGHFMRFEDKREDNKSAQQFLVKKSVGRTSCPVANYLYDKSQYVFGYSGKTDSDNGDMESMRKYFDVFKAKVEQIYLSIPNNDAIKAVRAFYQQEPVDIVKSMKNDALWKVIIKNLNKKYSNFSFMIDGDNEIVASKKDLLGLDEYTHTGSNICLITGNRSDSVEVTTATMIPGSHATAKLVSFQVNSGYDSYGKKSCLNSPISEEAEFKYTTALRYLLREGSHNKFIIGKDRGTRTFLYWASSDSEAAEAAEACLFDFLGKADDDPNNRVEMVRDTFMSIYSGKKPLNADDRFFILGLAPNAARIAVVYWAEIPLKKFAGIISKHFEDMDIVGGRKEKFSYFRIHSMLGAVTLGGKSSDAIPNLPDAVVKSIFQGLPYPASLFQACIRRIRAEVSKEFNGKKIDPVNTTRAAIIKAYLNRLKDNNNQKLNIMLDKENNNQGYLCGRLFAVLDKIQEEASKLHSIRERYMNSASATPAVVFATILNLSAHHQEKLSECSPIFYEKIKQEIISKLNADGFPSHLDLQDQGRFFVGYYHQRQDLFTSQKDKEE